MTTQGGVGSRGNTAQKYFARFLRSPTSPGSAGDFPRARGLPVHNLRYPHLGKNELPTGIANTVARGTIVVVPVMCAVTTRDSRRRNLGPL